MSAFGSTDSRISQAYDNFDDNFVRTRVTANGNAAQSAVHVHTSSRTCACVLNRRRLQLPCKCSIARLVSCRGRTTRLPVRVRRARGRARAARSGRGTCGGGALTFATFVFCKALTHFARKLCTLHEPRQHEPRPRTPHPRVSPFSIHGRRRRTRHIRSVPARLPHLGRILGILSIMWPLWRTGVAELSPRRLATDVRQSHSELISIVHSLIIREAGGSRPILSAVSTGQGQAVVMTAEA